MCTDDCYGLDGESETWANEEIMQCVKCSATLGTNCKICSDADTCLRCVEGYLID